MKIMRLRRTTAQIQRDLKTAIKMKHAAKKGPLSAPCESSTYPDVSPADAAGIQDDASSALCNAMGDLGIDPEVRSTPNEAHPNLHNFHVRVSDATGPLYPSGKDMLHRYLTQFWQSACCSPHWTQYGSCLQSKPT